MRWRTPDAGISLTETVCMDSLFQETLLQGAGDRGFPRATQSCDPDRCSTASCELLSANRVDQSITPDDVGRFACGFLAEIEGLCLCQREEEKREGGKRMRDGAAG